jgi:hypothetical protein
MVRPCQIATGTDCRRGLGRIAALHRIEADIRGTSADERRAAPQERSDPLTASMKARLEKTLAQVPGSSTLAQII